MRLDAAARKPSILVADDNVETLHFLTQMLRGEGYEVRPVLNGELALQAALNSPPDLMLLDILMPGISGYDVCVRLKAEAITQDIPVIFLTSMTEDEKEEKGFLLGAADYISKPIRIEVVKARVNVQIQLKMQKDRLKNQELELQQAYSEMEAFSYSVSHDLKSPIQTIVSYSEFALMEFEKLKHEEGIGDAKRIREACRQMNQIINDLQQLSRLGMESISLEKTDMCVIAKDIISRLEKRDSGRRMTFLCSENMVVQADKSLIRLALENLISNAWKYSRTNPAPCIEFGMEDKEVAKTFFVKDNGVGFDMGKACDLFNPFVRLHGNDYEGSGIGLAIVSRIIKRHNGWVWAESEVGKGTTIHFILS